MKNRKRKCMCAVTVLVLLLSLCGIAGKEDAAAEAETVLCNPVTDSDGVTTWDCVCFGNYWQNDTNGDGKADQNDRKEPIKWRVLSVNDNVAFLLADQNLDCQPYHNEMDEVTWENCTLRSWLNTTFLTTAFTSVEQEMLDDATITNENNPIYNTEGGNATSDKVFLLSIAEASSSVYGFCETFDLESNTRVAENTAYTASYNGMRPTDNADWWWLRSPGCLNIYASYVSGNGCGDNNGGTDVNNSVYAVRPVVRLKLSRSDFWTYAGKIRSDGKEISPTETPTETPTQSPTETPTQAPTETPTQAPTETPTQSPTETLTQMPTETPTQMPTETPTQSPTENPTQSSTETPTQAPTENLTQAPTKNPTQSPTKNPTQSPTKAPTEPSTSNVIESTVSVPAVRLKKVKKRRKSKVRVYWQKSVGVSGYRLQYAPNKKFRKNVKTKWPAAKKTSVTLTGLKKKKTYYVRICAYVLSDGKKVYGKWSTVKKVKSKK